MQVTIKDIALKAGVSTATVSRVVNKSPLVKEVTKKKVLDMIKELNYQPDLIARSMVKKRTFSIGLIVGVLGNPFFAETAEIIIKTIERFDFHVSVYVTEEKEEKMEEYIDLLINRRVDGVLIGSVFKGTSLDKLDKNNIPYVLYNRKGDHPNADYIIHDSFKGAFAAVSHLIHLGHKRIGIIHGPDKFDTVQDRISGYQEALKTFGLKQYEHFVQGIDFVNTGTEVPKVLENMLSNKVKPTAIFTTADYIALDAMDYLVKNNINIPKDLALIGIDNIRLSGHSLIQLTTVGLRAEEMAKLAAEKLMQKIEEKDRYDQQEIVPWRIKLEPELVIRKSCGVENKISDNDERKGGYYAFC